MEVYETLLAKEISRITHEHERFWRNSLFLNENDVFSNTMEQHNLPNRNLPDRETTKMDRFETLEPRLRGRRRINYRKARSTSNGLDAGAIYMERNQETRTCQNMNGVLGKLDVSYIL